MYVAGDTSNPLQGNIFAVEKDGKEGKPCITLTPTTDSPPTAASLHSLFPFWFFYLSHRLHSSHRGLSPPLQWWVQANSNSE